MNNTRKDIIKSAATAVAGLFVFAVGVYLTIQANIGAAPWDAFSLGLSSTLGVKYGTANIVVSLIIVALDIVMREKIGLGMLLDALLVGKFVDLLNFIGILPPQTKLPASLAAMAAGIVIMGFGQYMHMKAALGCGPRDCMLVGFKRRSKRIPIGIISVFILAAATLAGWLLGGPIGVGTLICAFLTGPVMQLDFRIVHFEPTEVEHQDIGTSLKILFGGAARE